MRPRQAQAVADLVAAYQSGKRAPILVAPTGFGKTHTSAAIIRRALDKGRRVWFLAHLREILGATSAKLTAEGIEHGLIQAGADGNRHLPVQVASVQTLVRRLEMHTPPDLMIVDEAHLAVAATYQTIFKWAPRAHLLHLTATPQRLDGRGMAEVADCIVPTCSTAELIAEGLLAPVKYYAPPVALDTLATRAGDFAADEAAAFMDKPKITGDAVAEWMKVARHRPTIVFCVSIQHAEHVAAAFVAAGVRARAVSGDTDTAARDQALADLQAGRLDVVCNCALWVAGVDAPSVSCIVLLAPTKSVTKYLQSVGRGLRTHPGKDACVVIDHAGLIGLHGSPLDARLWNLEGQAKGTARKATEVPVKTCPSCFRTVVAAATDCSCGHHFEVKPRTIAQVEGELVEIALAQKAQAEAVAAQAERNAALEVARRQARTIPDLIKVAERFGLDPRWAWKVAQSRKQRKQA